MLLRGMVGAEVTEQADDKARWMQKVKGAEREYMVGLVQDSFPS